MKQTALVAILITFIAFALRAYHLDFVSLRGDEAFTVNFVQRTWEGLWKGIRFIEPNPPLYYLALRAWVALAGASEFATRYFSAFFGVLCVPLIFRLAREMFVQPVIARSKATKPCPERSRRESPSPNWRLLPLRCTQGRNDTAALIAAALIAINPYQVWHSQDVRNYTMWPALSLASLFFFWRWWTWEIRDWRLETGSWKLKVGNWDLSFVICHLSFYVLATTASLYTHYYDTFILIAENIFVFGIAICGRRWRTLVRWMGAQIALVVVYLPWVLFFTNRVTTYGEGSAEQGVSLVEVFSRTLTSFTLGDTVPEFLKTILSLPLALGLLVILVYLARRERTRALFLFLYIAVPTLALYVITIGRPLFLERYLNGIAPAYYLAFAVGLAATQRLKVKSQKLKVAGVAWGVGILFFGVMSAYALANYYFDPAYIKAPDWRALMRFVTDRQRDGDILVQNFTDDSVTYYRNRFARHPLPQTPPPICGNTQNYLTVITLPKDYFPTAADEKQLQRLNVDCRRIWFIPAQPDLWDPDHTVENYLSCYADRELEARISEFRLQLYLTPREFEPKIIPVNARIGNATLVGYRVERARTLRVVLYWRGAQKIEKDYTVFVHLADASDRVIAQQDKAPVHGTYPTSAWQPGELIVDGYDLIDAAPGTYALLVGMYDPATLVRVPALDAKGAPLPNDRVLLTQVTITP
jgi:hypothetical protein